MSIKPRRMGEIELAQAREAARKPHRFEGAHPTKWSDMVERLLAHIAALNAENEALLERANAGASEISRHPLAPAPRPAREGGRMMAPYRVQLSRKKGWRMPENTVKVDRTTKYGNPFVVSKAVADGRCEPGVMRGPTCIGVPTLEDAVECFREIFRCDGEAADAIRAYLPELRGKNLACWCKLGTPCHADVLLELANREEP